VRLILVACEINEESIDILSRTGKKTGIARSLAVPLNAIAGTL